MKTIKTAAQWLFGKTLKYGDWVITVGGILLVLSYVLSLPSEDETHWQPPSPEALANAEIIDDADLFAYQERCYCYITMLHKGEIDVPGGSLKKAVWYVKSEAGSGQVHRIDFRGRVVDGNVDGDLHFADRVIAHNFPGWTRSAAYAQKTQQYRRREYTEEMIVAIRKDY